MRARYERARWISGRGVLAALCVLGLGAIGCSKARDVPAGPDVPREQSAAGAVRPYDRASPWNSPIGANPVISPDSRSLVDALADEDHPLSSDVDQYAIPVYFFDRRTPLATVRLGGYYSTYDAGDDSRVGYGFAPTIKRVPIPASALSSAGTDGQIVIWNPKTGVEYSFWQFAKDSRGGYVATNGYRYHSTSGYLGRMDDGKAGRGAGTPYLAGLVRPWEIARGRIDHALAFAYDSPSASFVYPASKSDGRGVAGTDLPEGSRLQLDPNLGEKDFKAWGLSASAKVIARALQTYGMYVIDNGGSSKIYLEDRLTAKWGPGIDRDLPANIPLKDFRVVKTPVRGR